MDIEFSPIRMDDPYHLTVDGDIIIINGEEFDFSPLPAGASLPPVAIDSKFFSDDVERTAEGVLVIRLLLPHGAKAPDARRYPSTIQDVPDGDVDLPPFDEVTA